MKRLVLISQHFPPEIGAASNRMVQLTTRLAQRGYTLYVVTGQPSYPEPNLYRGTGWREKEKEWRKKGIHLYRTPAITRLFTGKAARAVNQLLFFFCAWWISLYLCLRHSVRLVLTTSPPFPVNLIGYTLSRLFRVRWVMEVRDLWPDSLAAVTGWSKQSRLFRLLKKMEQRFYRSASTVIVVTQSFKEQLIKEGHAASKIEVITNGIPDWVAAYKQHAPPAGAKAGGERPSKEKSAPPAERSAKEKSTSVPFNVLYLGNIGLAQGLDKVLEAARLLQEEKRPIHFYFVGEGLAKAGLMERATSWGLDNVHFIPGQTEKNELATWYRKANVGLVSLKPDPLFETVIPSKLFEYGAWGLPILFIGRGEGAKLVIKYCLGESRDYDTIAIKQALLAFYRQEIPMDERKIKQFQQDFAWDQLIERYLHRLETAQESKSSRTGT